MPIVMREWRVVYRVLDDHVEVRVPGFYPRDQVMEVAERALKEDGWIHPDRLVPVMTSVTRVLRV